MATTTTATSTAAQKRRERMLAALRATALDESATPEEVAKAITELSREVGTIPPRLAEIRRNAIVALHSAGHSLSDITRMVGLSLRGGRLCQLMAEHRRPPVTEATDGTA
ncbi:MAG: hypothetical protein V4597_19315 [Pseudomonadota bacterium]